MCIKYLFSEDAKVDSSLIKNFDIFSLFCKY